MNASREELCDAALEIWSVIEKAKLTYPEGIHCLAGTAALIGTKTNDRMGALATLISDCCKLEPELREYLKENL